MKRVAADRRRRWCTTLGRRGRGGGCRGHDHDGRVDRGRRGRGGVRAGSVAGSVVAGSAGTGSVAAAGAGMAIERIGDECGGGDDGSGEASSEVQRCSFLPTRHAWGGRRRGNRSGAQGKEACRSTSGDRTDRGRRRGAGVPRTRGQGPREGAVALRFRVLSACGWLARTVPEIGPAVPFSGGPIRGVPARYLSAMPDADPRPVVILRPAPQRVERIFAPAALERLPATTRSSTSVEDGVDRGRLDAALPRAFAIVGQPDLPARAARRARARCASCINVEGNFFPNVDYDACFRARHPRARLRPGVRPGRRRVRPRPRASTSPAGSAARTARSATGRERYVAAGNADAILLRHARHRSRRLRQPRPRPAPRCCVPFDATIRAFDPWLPAVDAARGRARPGDAREVLTQQPTSSSSSPRSPPRASACWAPRELDLLPHGARLVLVSRAAVIDYDALLERVAAGRFLAAIDVWPEEPVPADDRARALDGPGALRRTARAASRRRSSRSARWSSTTSTRSARACRRCGCSPPRASWWAATATGP